MPLYERRTLPDMSKQTVIGINGCGRIGRKIIRLAATTPGIRVAAINDMTSPDVLAHLLKFDSVHGTWDADIRTEGQAILINGQKIQITAEKDPSRLQWKQAEVDIVHESTGVFTERAAAAQHLTGGAKRVIISAPANDSDLTVCFGVNHTQYDPSKHVVISHAPCTTNCLAPVAKVIDEAFGIIKGTMLTVHSYTNDQRILDLPHKDLRRARAAALSMIPTSTGAAKAVGLVLPHLKGKLDGLAIRVPTPNVSIVDFTCEVKTATTKEAVNEVLKNASNGAMKGVLGFEVRPLVSCDFNGSILSSVIDADCTTVLGGNMIKILTWYDNESGFSSRMLDVTRYIAEKGI